MDNSATDEEIDLPAIKLPAIVIEQSIDKTKHSITSIPEIICTDNGSAVIVGVNGGVEEENLDGANGDVYANEPEVIVREESPLPPPPQRKSLCYRIFCCCCIQQEKEKEPVKEDDEEVPPLPVGGKISIVEGADDSNLLCARGRRIGLSERNRADREVVVEKLHNIVLEDNKKDFGF